MGISQGLFPLETTALGDRMAVSFCRTRSSKSASIMHPAARHSDSFRMGAFKFLHSIEASLSIVTYSVVTSDWKEVCFLLVLRFIGVRT